MSLVSIILTAYREPKTVGKALLCLADPHYSGYSGDLEVLLMCPDDATAEAGTQAAQQLQLGKRFRVIRDPQQGKPWALNLAFKEAKGDIFVLSDGDVHVGKGAVGYMLEAFGDKAVGGVSGRPIANHRKSSLWNYWGNLLADGAHRQRLKTKGTEDSFFPLSGYLLAIRNVHWQIPPDTLVDDAYISYILIQQGYRLAYAPQAEVFVKYPQSLGDYLRQKKRSVGGYIQLKQYPEITYLPQTRSMWLEATQFTGFVLSYAHNPLEFLWSLLLFPFRLWLWLVIWWERVVRKKDFVRTWERVESTK